MTPFEEFAKAALQGLLAEPCSVGAPTIVGKLTAGMDLPMADRYARAAFELAKAMEDEKGRIYRKTY